MIYLKVTDAQVGAIHADLARPHEYALERVGFLCGRFAQGGVVLAHHYEPLRDVEYINAPTAAATFSGAAIRRMRQRSLTTGDSMFHVHVHDHRGTPWFSRTDLRSLREVLPSFSSVAPSVPHGALLLSHDEAVAVVWADDDLRAAEVTVVGYPLRTAGRS